MVISIEIMFFQVRENLKNISKTNIILTYFTLAKKSPRDFSFFFFTRRGREGPGSETCRSSAVVLTKHLSASSYQARTHGAKSPSRF